MKRLDNLRWRLAIWLAPEIDTARGKRRLEELARDCGASRTLAVRIASAYFEALRRDIR